MAKRPKVLMLGWEYPPVFSGGLGVVTKNLAQALVRQGADLTLVLPQFITHKIIRTGYDPGVKLLSFAEGYAPDDQIKTKRVPTFMYSPYLNAEGYQNAFSKYQNGKTPFNVKDEDDSVYGQDLWTEIDRFAAEVVALTEHNEFDLVHAHDWITAEAALQLKLQRGLNFILHIHATEVDRTGTTNKDSEVFKREQYAMTQAIRVVTVSQYTKKLLVDHYGIDPEKIIVVYNAYEVKTPTPEYIKARQFPKNKKEFWVLFIGRVTLQKGPEYFVETAAKVVPHNPDVHFHIAGDGDMMPQIKAQIKRCGLEANVHCHGFLPPAKRDALYMLADACIIPSVSEPFGLTAIEVIDHCTPLIISKNCGANEIIGHKLEVDFFDTDKIAEYVLALKRYPELRRTLRTKAMDNKGRLTWEAQASRMMEIYENYS
jgi:glycosyltransferase involved in cell wall biosynthesis